MAPGSRKRIRVDATQVQHRDTAQSLSSEPTTPNTTASSVGMTKFEIRLDDPYVRANVESLLQHRSKDARYRYHQRFLKHPTIEEAKRDPPEDLTQENWEALCDFYANPQYQRDPLTNEEPGRITFYEHTHKTDEKWTCPEAESQFNDMENLKKNCNMTDDEAADRVLGTRSDYIKGLGYGPKPNTSASSNRRNVELEEALKETRKENEFLKEQAKTQNETIQNILAKQVEYDKFFKSIMEMGLLPNTSSTPSTTWVRSYPGQSYIKRENHKIPPEMKLSYLALSHEYEARQLIPIEANPR
ncbi:hypothetical protein LguiB_006018 [Lonicera macranthoides]